MNRVNRDASSAVRALTAAVLASAFVAIANANGRNNNEHLPREARRAWLWMAKGTAGGVFTYQNCCDLLGLYPEAGRAYARRIMNGEVTLDQVAKLLDGPLARRAPDDEDLKRKARSEQDPEAAGLQSDQAAETDPEAAGLQSDDLEAREKTPSRPQT